MPRLVSLMALIPIFMKSLPDPFRWDSIFNIHHGLAENNKHEMRLNLEKKGCVSCRMK